MNQSVDFMIRTLLIGVGATLVMDAWLLLLRRLGISTLDMALLGRWIGHVGKGRFAHPNIGQAHPVTNESIIGWCGHYAIGVTFAAVLLSILGLNWTRSPSLLPAVLFGLVTVLAPLLILQPALGAGIASSKTPTPILNCFKSIVTHTVFGLGLYLAALATRAYR